jgi:hypothetical protein
MKTTIEEAEQYLTERFGQPIHYESTGGNCTAFTNEDETIVVTYGDDCWCNEVYEDGAIETDGGWTVGRYPSPAYEGVSADSLEEMKWENIK